MIIVQKVLKRLNLMISARDRLFHLSLESNRLMFQLLGAFSTFDALSIELGDTSLWETDIADSFLSHLLWDRVMRALDNRLLGDTDLVFLVDVGVSLDGLAIPVLLILKNFLDVSLLDVKLDASFFFLSDLLLGSLRKRSAFLRFGSVRFSKESSGLEDTTLGALEVSSLVLVVVSTETTVRSISRALLLNNDSLSLMFDSVVGSVNLNNIVIRPVGCNLLKGRL